jgi:peptidoglycan hydrolase CwlO-like protein
MSDNLIERLATLREEAAAEIARLTAERDAEREARERLEAALRPFAQPERNSAYSDASHELISVTSGDLRRARAALGGSDDR